MRRKILARVCDSSFYQGFSINIIISISISPSVHKGQVSWLVSWYRSSYFTIAEKQEIRDFLGLQGILDLHEVPLDIKKWKMCKLGIIYYFFKLRIRIEIEAPTLVAVLLDAPSDMKVWQAPHYLAAQSSEVLIFWPPDNYEVAVH